jgi:hypothetical protein
MNNDTLTKANWSENVVIVDADYVDRVAFDLIVNFERMIGRRIHKADLAKWIDCVALDGGLREGEHDTQVVLIHDKKQAALDNFVPASYDDELNGKAFKDHLGEFTVSSFPVEDITTATDFFLDTVAMVCAQKEVKRVMIIPDAENRALYADLRHTLQRVDDEKRITVFAMQPMEGGNFRQEILGYSLMNALGIRAEELK